MSSNSERIITPGFIAAIASMPANIATAWIDNVPAGGVNLGPIRAAIVHYRRQLIFGNLETQRLALTAVVNEFRTAWAGCSANPVNARTVLAANDQPRIGCVRY